MDKQPEVGEYWVYKYGELDQTIDQIVKISKYIHVKDIRKWDEAAYNWSIEGFHEEYTYHAYMNTPLYKLLTGRN